MQRLGIKKLPAIVSVRGESSGAQPVKNGSDLPMQKKRKVEKPSTWSGMLIEINPPHATVEKRVDNNITERQQVDIYDLLEYVAPKVTRETDLAAMTPDDGSTQLDPPDFERLAYPLGRTVVELIKLCVHLRLKESNDRVRATVLNDLTKQPYLPAASPRSNWHIQGGRAYAFPFHEVLHDADLR